MATEDRIWIGMELPLKMGVVEGVVKALHPHVGIAGMSGLLHISPISNDRTDDREKVLQPGMSVNCMIIDHDKSIGRDV